MLVIDPTWLGTFAGACGTTILGVGGWLVREHFIKNRENKWDLAEETEVPYRQKNRSNNQRLINTIDDLRTYMQEQTEVMKTIATALEQQNIRSEFRHNDIVERLRTLERGQA